MVAYKALILETTKNFKELAFINVLREKNSKADQLAIEASQLKPRIKRSVSVEIIRSPSIAHTKKCRALVIS